MNQSEVNEDFSHAKAPPTQVLFSTFWQGIEPYVRQLGEEDLAFLKGYKVHPTSACLFRSAALLTTQVHWFVPG